MCIRDRHRLAILHAEDVVEFFQIFPKARVVVSTSQRYFKHVALRHFCGYTRERLFSASADANKQRVPILCAQDAVDSRQMFQRVVEEHESRWRRTVFEFRIVIDDQLFKPRFDGCVISDIAVLTKRVIEIRVFFERDVARGRAAR